MIRLVLNKLRGLFSKPEKVNIETEQKQQNNLTRHHKLTDSPQSGESQRQRRRKSKRGRKPQSGESRSGESGGRSQRSKADAKPAAEAAPTESSTDKPAEGDSKSSGSGSGGEDGKSTTKRRRRRRRRKSGDRESRPDTAAADKPERSDDDESVDEDDMPIAVPDSNWDLSEFDVPEEEGKVRFHDFDLPRCVMHAVADLNFRYCTPIQAEIMTSTLKGRDATGQAQTGTGKTAAFLITMLNHFHRNPLENRKNGTPRGLILAPTRELVLQITKDARSLSRYCGTSVLTVYGGTGWKKQQMHLQTKPVDIVAATPGRLLDFYQSNTIDLSQVEILVLDEADRMLDMGFIPDVKQIIYATPQKDTRQTLFFSATLPDEVIELAGKWTRDAVTVKIEPEHVAVDTVEQEVYITTTAQKPALLYNIITRKNLERVIVFSNRREDTRRLGDLLFQRGIDCAILTGDVPQNKRTRTLEDFRAGKIRVLIATDVAGRGIHIEGLDHVINFTLPMDPEDYVHRIGRTGRAGASGTSVSFACEEDAQQIPDIEDFIGKKLPSIQPDDDWYVLPEATTSERHPQNKGGSGSGSGGSRSRRGGGGGKGRGGRGRSRRSGGGGGGRSSS